MMKPDLPSNSFLGAYAERLQPGDERIMGGVSQEDAQMIVDYMFHTLYMAFKESDFEVVDTPGSDTIRFKTALSNVADRWVGLDVVSTIVPQLRVTAEPKGAATGKPSFVGSAVVQYKATDAKIGKVLAAGVDRRVGGKTLGKGLGEWDDGIHAIDYWGALINLRTCRLRGETNCPMREA